MKKIIPIVLGVLLFASCGGKNILDEDREFNRDIWNRFTPESFEFQVNNTNDYYNIDLTVAIDTAIYRYRQFPVYLELKSPDGESRRFNGQVDFMERGSWRGEEQGPYRVITGRMRSYMSFNSKGHHTLEVGQTTSQYDLEGIHSIKANIYKVKLDYDKL